MATGASGYKINSNYDIIIIGAGPGGANFARLADSGRYRILLVDGSISGRSKVCGGLISPDAQDVLARYDINLPGDILVSPQLFSVRTIDLCTGIIRHYRRSYLNTDRDRFDGFMRSMVPGSVDRVCARCTDIVYSDSQYCVTLQTGTYTHKVNCRYIIGADGASSVVRKKLFGDHPIKRYTAIQQWFPAEYINPFYSCIFDSSTSEGCSWIFFKNDYLVFGGAFEPHGSRIAFEAQKRKLTDMKIADLSSAPLRTEACTVLRPRITGGIFCGNDSAFLIGEAAGFISPSSLEGISFALSSAEALADALGSGADKISLVYRMKALRLREKIFFKCLKRPFMYNQLLRTAVMKSEFGTVNIRTPDTHR